MNESPREALLRALSVLSFPVKVEDLLEEPDGGFLVDGRLVLWSNRGASWKVDDRVAGATPDDPPEDVFLRSFPTFEEAVPFVVLQVADNALREQADGFPRARPLSALRRSIRSVLADLDPEVEASAPFRSRLEEALEGAPPDEANGKEALALAREVLQAGDLRRSLLALRFLLDAVDESQILLERFAAVEEIGRTLGRLLDDAEVDLEGEARKLAATLAFVLRRTLEGTANGRALVFHQEDGTGVEVVIRRLEGKPVAEVLRDLRADERRACAAELRRRAEVLRSEATGATLGRRAEVALALDEAAASFEEPST